MAVQFEEQTSNGVYGPAHVFKCGTEHSLFIEKQPTLAVRQFFSWSQNGTVEVYGGRQGREVRVDCWVHDTTFSSLQAIDAYLAVLDEMAGQYGRVTLTVPVSQTLTRDDCRFVGFVRKPFNGQQHPEPLPAIGVHSTSYGDWHIAGTLVFFQLFTG